MMTKHQAELIVQADAQLQALKTRAFETFSRLHEELTKLQKALIVVQVEELKRLQEPRSRNEHRKRQIKARKRGISANFG